MTASERQKGFIPLFIFVTLIDVIVAIGVASQDEIWQAFAMIWTGPMDDICYFILAVQGLFYLLDPSGSYTRDAAGGLSFEGAWSLLKEGKGAEKEAAQSFFTGAPKALLLLSCAFFLSLIVNLAVGSYVTVGILASVFRYLSLMFPICLVVGLGLSLLRLGQGRTFFWQSVVMASAVIFVMAVFDGRWHNHAFHLLSNLENLLAWCVCISWVSFFAAYSAPEAPAAES